METLRLTEEDAATLGQLAATWRCSRSEAVRRLLGLMRAAERMLSEREQNE